MYRRNVADAIHTESLPMAVELGQDVGSAGRRFSLAGMFYMPVDDERPGLITVISHHLAALSGLLHGETVDARLHQQGLLASGTLALNDLTVKGEFTYWRNPGLGLPRSFTVNGGWHQGAYGGLWQSDGVKGMFYLRPYLDFRSDGPVEQRRVG